MRNVLILVFTLTFFQLFSQKQEDLFSTGTETVVGTSTLLICHNMKSNCKQGRLIRNEKTGIADTSVVFIDGYIRDMTGKNLPQTFFKFIEQKTKISSLLITDSTGRMRISGFEAGIYTLEISSFGYQDLIIEDLKFGPGDKRNIIVDLGEYCCTDVEVKLEDHGYPPGYKKPDKQK